MMVVMYDMVMVMRNTLTLALLLLQMRVVSVDDVRPWILFLRWRPVGFPVPF